MLKMHLHF
jgi:hypothetical protein